MSALLGVSHLFVLLSCCRLERKRVFLKNRLAAMCEENGQGQENRAAFLEKRMRNCDLMRGMVYI